MTSSGIGSIKILGGSVTGCFVGAADGVIVVGFVVVGTAVGASLGMDVGALEGVAVGLKVDGAEVGATVGASLGDTDGDSDSVTVGLSVGSSVVTHRPPSPCSMKHVLSLEQQGTTASPSSSSSHLSPEATHVVGSNDGEADGTCEGKAVGTDEGEAVGGVEGDEEEVTDGDNDGDDVIGTVGLKVGLAVKVDVGSMVASILISGGIVALEALLPISLLNVSLRAEGEVVLATVAFSWRDRWGADARKVARRWC